MSFGIALAGGGCRGAAHVGVLLALEEAGLRPSSISGASAGSIVAGLYACGMSPAAMRGLIVRLSPRGRRLLDIDLSGMARAVVELATTRKISLSGILRGRRLRGLLEEYSGGRLMREARLPLFIPAVDLKSGDTIAFHSTERTPRPIPGLRWVRDAAIADVMLASSAVPAVFAPVRLGDCRLVDGGVANVLPVDLLLAHGERNVIAIDIAEDYATPLDSSLFEVASHSFTIMSSRLRRCAAQGERLLIQPKLPEEAGLFTFSLMEACVEAGYRAARELVPVIAAL